MTNSSRTNNRTKSKNSEPKNEKAKLNDVKNDKIKENQVKNETKTYDNVENKPVIDKNVGENEMEMKTDKQDDVPIERPTSQAKQQEEEDKDVNKINDTQGNHFFELIGHNVPCLPLEILKRTHSSSRPSSSSLTASSHWVLAPFQNPARTDGLKLKHWARSDDHQVSKFAKFNTKSNIFSYSTEEYYHLLRDDDWTKEETDYLFELINTFDVRFPIVHDRYEFVGSHERSLDDLKARYYSICQKLIQNRPSTSTSTADEPNKKQSLIQSYHFDKQREIERKKHVQSLLNRSKSQLLEEEFIYIETRRLEQTLLKRIRNRNELMKLIGGYHHEMLNELKFWPAIEQNHVTPLQQLPRQSSHHRSSSLNTGNSTINPIQLKKNHNHLRRSETLEEDISISAGGDEPDSNFSKVPSSNMVNPEFQVEQDRKNCIYRFDSFNHQPHATGSMGTSSTGGSHYRSVGLRSTRITLPKTVAASTRISAVMHELKIPSLLNYLPKPLMMPTRENVECYERLIQAINQLVDLKRVVDRVESELKTQRKKLDSFMNNNHHHNHHHHSNLNVHTHQSNSSISHHPGPTKPDGDLTSSADILPVSPADNTTSPITAEKLESNPVVTPDQDVENPDSPTLNRFKCNLNKKRSASVTSSCSNNTGGDPSINPRDASATKTITAHHLDSKAGNHFNSRKKIRKN